MNKTFTSIATFLMLAPMSLIAALAWWEWRDTIHIPMNTGIGLFVLFLAADIIAIYNYFRFRGGNTK